IVGVVMHKPVTRKKVIVLGIDAMDPNITEKLFKETKLPNLFRLRATGAYSRLTTTMPAESAVAWTSFATGMNPGSHGIFDFIMRDPKTYFPYLSLNEISNVKGGVKIQIRRKGDTFWNILFRNKIPCFVYFCPNTFPPDALYGRMLSGMGVPDISGTMGRFSFYTTKVLNAEDKDSRGRVIYIDSKNNIIETEIYGPKVNSKGTIIESAIPLRIVLSPERENISLEFQGKHIFLKEGNWSDWQRISFKIGIFKRVYGIARFYLKSIQPELELYMSPINFNPENPPFPISYPKNYSAKLAKKIGLYYTQGMPHDTWALSEGRLDEKAFLEHVDEILRERREILNKELAEFKSGVFFFYFDTLDMVQHMFWRYLDAKHPLYEKNPLYQNSIFRYYEKIDQIIGEVLKGVDKDTTLIILSDHGFGSFRKSIHLNRWLLEKGLLFLKPGKEESKEFFEDVDWSKTKAYALGFGGIYINKIGREGYGVVNESEVRALKQAIILGLTQLEDPQTNEKVINNVYSSDDIFKGPYINDAPDLFVGFNNGYRASWQTALGGVPKALTEDNRKKWSGEHLLDFALVPGIIFMNKKINLDNPSIIDIAPTLLGLFSINKPEAMPGKILFRDEDK
ncbi:MAG: alkaline phosphatase family protein, partial [Candidatus Omnitrophica bacterium]|nr:alkaline phosphatase family protein [Candidatus Omnitrophota bacterium]